MVSALPDARGHFDQFGGKFVPEALWAALAQLEQEFRSADGGPGLRRRARRPARRLHRPALADHRGDPVRRARPAGRTGPAPLILLKREDLNHTGSHKINNVLGQALLTRRMGKTRVIAETGAGQHGVATATAAALFGLECTVYMGKVDTERQALNVARMRLLGAEVIAVESGTQTLKDAMNEAMRDWVASVDHTHYLIGTVAGPHPFPLLVREFQRVISTEARAQVLDRYGRLPDAVAACVGGGSNALGIFADFIPDAEVALHGYEAGGDGVSTGRHAATISAGSVGVLHGMRTFVLQDDDGQTKDSHSISAGLDYPGRRPRALVARGDGPGDVRARHRRRGDGGLPAAHADRGDPAGHRVRARPGRRAAARPVAAPAGRRRAGDHPREPLRARGQGRRHRHPVVQRRHARHGLGVGAPGGHQPERRPEPRPRRWTRTAPRAPRRSSCERDDPPGGGPAGHVGFDRGQTGGVFAATREQGRGALVGFLHVGYPDVPTSLAALRALTGEGESRRGRPRRDRAALQRPDDGRRDGAARRHARPAARRPDAGRARGRRGGRRAPARRPWS